ncbi:unnamed protein product [Victoria cruziana]
METSVSKLSLLRVNILRRNLSWTWGLRCNWKLVDSCLGVGGVYRGDGRTWALKVQSEVGGEQLVNFWLEERGWGFLYQLWRGNDWVQRDDLLHASAGHALFGHSAIRRVV